MCKRLFSALLGLLLLCAPAPARAAAADRMAGIDISVYQGDVDFETARDNGVEVVYIRASYGSDGVDSALYSHYEGARAAGRKLGFYHYLTALDTESARAQAGFFAGLIRNLDYDCRPALDFEVYRGLDRDQATAVAAAFLETLENELDITPMLYADAYVASTRFTGALSRYPLWVAQWEVAAPDLSGTPWETWAGWQYTDLGRVAGLDGYVDRDWFTGEVLLDPGPAPQPYPYYTVRAGDTLWSIARRYYTTVAELVRLNAIADPNRIYVGQVLKIPSDGSDYQAYTVRAGDTLWAIAQRYYTTVAELARLNAIADPNRIYGGQVLKIPLS